MLLNAKLPGVMVDRLYEIFEYGRQQKINWKIEKKKTIVAKWLCYQLEIYV